MQLPLLLEPHQPQYSLYALWKRQVLQLLNLLQVNGIVVVVVVVVVTFGQLELVHAQLLPEHVPPLSAPPESPYLQLFVLLHHPQGPAQVQLSHVL